jgi:chorismate dehydratase
MPRYRIGSVPYLNARPIVVGLDRDPSVEYSEHVPSRLADLLRENALDCALVSSIEATRIAGSQILDAPCIASNGPVLSVRLVGREDPRRARSVALDGASRTAAILARIVYARFLQRSDVEFVAAPPAPDPRATGADATLVIGDAALRPDLDELKSLDLGEAWTNETGLPFVFAVWLAREGAPKEPLERILRAARDAGVPRAAELASAGARKLGIPQATAIAYLTNAIRFDLGDAERRGLARFFELAASLA